ncbi:TPA: hypothetical protein VGT17_000439 [Vibrio harveyi]|nr:hypothetical protein [Vibrio harveyi]HEQ3598092.1 hypothetical protein [Vibrio harveyi]HEQ3606627.1 hypothetical protein [Vibrio harveyi]
MKMVFVDAENVGLKELEKLRASAIDKVFVFSKSEAIKQCCEKNLFLYLSDYPNGQNQADFYIVAYLSRILTMLDKKQLGTVSFELYSNDESLISAYEFQCSQMGVLFRVVRTKEETVVPIKQQKKQLSQSPEEKIYQALKVPTALDPSFQETLGLSRQVFTRAVNVLSTTNKIQRSTENKKKWVRC